MNIYIYIYIYIYFVITYFLIQYLDIHGPLGRGGYTPIAPLALQVCEGIVCCFENISKGSVCIVSPFESKQYPII